MPGYLRIATTWLTGCSGCHIAALDLADELESLLHVAEFGFTPIGDIRDVEPSDVGLVEGCVSTNADEELLRRMRERCKTLVAMGTCAMCGGMPALRNAFAPAKTVSHCYVESPGLDAAGNMPVGEPPPLRRRAEKIADVVDIDAEIPGCPPTPEMISSALLALARGEQPVFGMKNLCVECDREHSTLHTPRRQFLADYTYESEGFEEDESTSFLVPRSQIDEMVHAAFELDEIDPKQCFLEQGVLCMGPATRQGCGASCLSVNYPCRGCFGPTPRVLEQGSRMMDSVATVLPPSGLVRFEDLIGTGYRFSPPSFMCKLEGEEEEEEG